MSLRSGVLVLFVLLATATSSWPGGAAVKVGGGARVIKVLPGKPQRVTIGRGRKAGLKVGDTGEVFPIRTDAGTKTESVQFDLRIATGKVTEVKDDTATVILDAIAEPVEVGAWFWYELEAPEPLAKSPLFRVVAVGAELKHQNDDTLFITTEQMLADPSEALRNKALDSMLAEIKAMRAVIVDALKDRIEQGKHHGQTAGQVVDLVDRAELLEFFLYVEAYPRKYIGHRWALPEIYFTWVISGTPSGEDERKEKALASTIRAAQTATAAGKLDDARARWTEVLKVLPGHKVAAENIAKIDKILLLTRTVASDPDDTTSSYELADELFNVGAYNLSLTATDPLRKRGYEPFKVERLRAQLFVRLEKFSDAEAIFKRLVKDHPDDTGLRTWLDYSHARARVQKSPNDPAALVELANVNFVNKAWSSALDNFRKVLANPKATAAQRDMAKAAQERISIQTTIDGKAESAQDYIKTHEINRARDMIKVIIELTDKLKDSAQQSKILGELASTARAASEEELSLQLYATYSDQAKTTDAYAALAYALLGFDRLDEAETVAKKAIEQKGDVGYPYLILAYVAQRRGDLAEMEKLAKKASANNPKYPWPLLVLARAEAARGDWDEAVELAKKALDLKDQEYEMRTVLAAAFRGQQAQQVLQSNASSARERLRLVRALATMGLARRVSEEVAKLPADGTWRSDGWQALADSSDGHVTLKDRLAAARAAAPTTVARKRNLAILEARAALRANPKDDAKRIELASLYLQKENWDAVLATLGSLMTVTPLKPDVGDLVNNARLGIEADAQLDLARAAGMRLDYDGALRIAAGTVKLYDRLGAIYGRTLARDIVAESHYAAGRYNDAIKVTEESLKVALSEGDPSTIASAQQLIGRYKASMGSTDAQRKPLEDSLKSAEDRDDEGAVYNIYNQLSSLASDEGQSSESIDFARKAWTIADRIGRRDYARNARFQLANANLIATRFTDAEQIALKLLADSRAANDVGNEQYALMVLGVVSMYRGEGKPARIRFQEVYDLGTRTGDVGWRALARRFEGSSWLVADHDPAKAAIALEQSDALYKSIGAGWATIMRTSVLNDLADARLTAGKIAPARQAAEEGLVLAERFQRRPALTYAHWILALIAIKENKVDEAMKRAQTALGFAQQTQNDYMLWTTWYAVARANELKKQDQVAIDAYEKALEFLGKSLQATGGDAEKQGFTNTGRVRELYSNAIALLLRAGKTQRAMEILEVSRDAMLKQQFDPTKVQTKDAKVRGKLDQIQQKRERVQGLEKQLVAAMDKPAAQRSDTQVKALSERIAQSKAELNQVVLDLKHDHRVLFQALAMDPQNLVGRRDALPAGSVLVEYFVAEDALYAFVISRNLAQPAVVRTNVTSAQLEAAIEEWRNAIVAENDKVRQRDKVEELGRKLNSWLLEPLRPHLKDATAVIVLPFGPLFYVPFDALVVSDVGQPLRYAIEDYRFSIQTATTLEHLFKTGRTRLTGTMLAISNPDGSLPGATVEVARIVKNAMPDAQVLTRKDATVKKFGDMAGRYRYLHLATHGILDVDPRKSYMKFSDGPLTVEKIAQLQGLDTANEMVVLSACDTAVEAGKSNGDELVSVAYAFAMAGSPALVASLWEVSDESTAELMSNFYRALEQSKGDRLDALREAKLSLMRMQKGATKPFNQPWHWSSFQMYGDYRTPAPAPN